MLLAIQLHGTRRMQWTDRIGRRLKLRDLHILLAVAQAACGKRPVRRHLAKFDLAVRSRADADQDTARPAADESTAYSRHLIKESHSQPDCQSVHR